MLDPDGLNVWSDQQLVGYLWRNGQGQLGFRYDDSWLPQKGFAISHTLPLGATEFAPETGMAHRFFANLLPEGSLRTQIVRDLKIANSDFDLLRAIGGECAGALTLLQPERDPETNYQYYQLSDDDLANLVARRGNAYTWASHKRPRLSLAGAQDKCPILVKDNAYWLPQQEAPSSHILKFELADYRHLPAYETFTTRLAKSIGLPVVNIALERINDACFALIERYDRRLEKNHAVTRFHQEDFCQALGLGYERKYQEDGGPSFADCFRLVQDVSSDPGNDLQHLLRWQIFNVLAGNSDGHAKNLSLLYLPNGDIRLAPFYDLVCTRAIERIDYHLAFAIGDERDPGKLSASHWKLLAEQCGIRPQFLQQQLTTVAQSLLQQLEPIRNTFDHDYGPYPALQRVEHVVRKQCQRIVIE